VLSLAYEECIYVLGQFSGLSRAAKLLQVITWQASRIGKLLLVPFQIRQMGCDEIRLFDEFPVRNVNLINPFV